ncbi:HIR2 (YOR038C) [Zygosaccharomyces parabailii]|nr:HIR2 (YOR038C) [Zygosaccharomyces parabailii]SJM82825.1 probable protein HIR2 [Zygosaccharomyces bailii]
MRLLKYPLVGHNNRVEVMVAIDPWLVTADCEGHVNAWSQQRFVDAAFNGAQIRDLAIQFKFTVEWEPGEPDKNIVFLSGDSQSLFMGTEHRVMCYRSWQDPAARTLEYVCRCDAPSTVNDVKYDPTTRVLFVLLGNKNGILLFQADTLENVGEIELPDGVVPVAGVVDPMGQVFMVMCSDRSLMLYQFNYQGSYKLVHKFSQYVQVNPLHYKISMPPQGDLLPVINSIKGSSPTSTNSTLLLDRNDNFKISTTLVSPPSAKCQVMQFSPVVYEKTNAKKNTKVVYNLLATSGSKDGSIVVWNTKRVKPLFNAIQASETPINDMAWSKDGLNLYVISNDNILYIFAFQEKDLGRTLSEEQVLKLQAQNKRLNPLPEREKKPSTNAEVSETPPPAQVPAPVKVETEQLLLPAPEIENKKHSRKKIAPHNLKKTQSTSMEFNGPAYNVPKDLKRKPKNEASKELNGTKKAKKELEPMDFLDTGLILPSVAFSRVRLDTPKIRLNFDYCPPNNLNLIFQVRNGLGNEQKPTIVTLISKAEEQERTLFQDFVPKFITMCTCGDFFWSCCSADGIIYVYSDSGKRLLPPLCLGVPCSFLEACANFLLCVTSTGQLYCWNIEQKRLLFPMNTVYPLLNPSLRYSDDVLTRAENITLCAITKKGIPLVTLSNGDGYMFDKDMETWLLISDGWWAYGSQYWDMTNTSHLNGNIVSNEDDKRNKFWNSTDAEQLASTIRDDQSSIINFMECKTNDELNRKNRIKNLQRFARTILMKEGFENMEEIVTLSHLENRLLVTLRLGEHQEFSKVLVVYCIRLSELGYTERLDDVLQWLYNDGNYDTAPLAGNSRRELLKGVLVACADIRHVQRVTTAYASALGMVNDSL